MNQNQQHPAHQVETFEGPLVLHFTNPGSVQTAGTKFPSDPKKRTVQIPDGAEITLRNRKAIEVKFDGTNIHWSTDVVKAATKNGERLF